jgi:hypothetical protein
MIEAGARFLRETYDAFPFDAEHVAGELFSQMTIRATPTLRRKLRNRSVSR